MALMGEGNDFPEVLQAFSMPIMGAQQRGHKYCDRVIPKAPHPGIHRSKSSAGGQRAGDKRAQKQKISYRTCCPVI